MRFPVLCIPQHFGGYVVGDQACLGKCRPAELSWREDVYKGMRIVDSNGKTFDVTHYVVRPATRIRMVLARMFDWAVEVTLDVEPTKPFSLDQLKAVVRTSINIDAETFDERSCRSAQVGTLN